MASHQSIGSGSSSKSGKSSSMGQQVLCYHNQIAPLRTVKYDGPTKGKRFYGCSYWPEQRTCGFFKWVDEIDEVGDLQMLLQQKDSKIAELEQEMEELKQKVKRLKAKKEKLQDEVGEMGIATTETLFQMKENNTDKKLMLTLVFSWAFFTLVLLMK
ncbi:DNA topoisomerase 3-alpha [Bienertia sinuspersici]